MLTYNLDTNALERYDGTAFVKVPDEADVDAAGGLVAVKTVLKTDTQVQSSVAARADFTITGMTITHEVADPANRLILMAYVGVAGSTRQLGNVGIALYDGTNLIGIGDAGASSQTRVAAGGRVSVDGGTRIVTMPSIHLVHTPGAGSKTYELRAINIGADPETLYINRSENDGSAESRGSSSFTLMEVKV